VQDIIEHLFCHSKPATKDDIYNKNLAYMLKSNWHWKEQLEPATKHILTIHWIIDEVIIHQSNVADVSVSRNDTPANNRATMNLLILISNARDDDQ